jgi:hypothetical protein
VFEPADNVAITAFEARAAPKDPTRVQALVQVFNASQGARRAQLEVSGADGHTVRRDLELPAGQAKNTLLDVTPFEGVLRARVSLKSDAFDFDNVAYCYVAPHRAKRVLLVTPGNAYLESALRHLSGIQSTISDASAYGAAGQFDVYIFDRFAPAKAPPGAMLLFRPPPSPWLPEAREVEKPALTKWDPAHPLAGAIQWQDVHLERAALAPVPPRADSMQAAIVLARGSQEGAAVLAGEGASRWVQVGFALEDSNLPLQAGFPVFLAAALDWLVPGQEVLERGLGTIAMPLGNAQVTDIDGRPVGAIWSGGRTLFEAVKPGVFTIRSGPRQFKVVANGLEPQLSEINRSRFADRPARGEGREVAIAKWSFDAPMVLLALGAALLTLEWFTYSRRVTV